MTSVTSTGSPAANTILYRKTATGGETSVTITYGTKFAKSVVAVVYRGLNPTTPIDSTPSSGTAAASTSVTAPSLTTTGVYDRLTLFGGGVGNASAASWTAPSGMTSEVQKSDQASTSAAIVDQTVPAAGATGTRTATLSTTAQLTAILLALQPARTTYAFDSRGNRTSVTPPSGSSSSFSYDQANRLTAYGSSATYKYDGRGQRMSKTVNSTAETFTWDEAASLPLLLVDATSTSTTDFIYGVGGQPLEAILSSGSVYYFHQDQLGSTRALTDQTGSVVGTYTYDAYGNLTGSTGTVTPSLLYAGQYRDAESGLYYLRARYYDPATAQFLTRDPLVAKTRSPYGYVFGNPLNLSDPLGLDGSWCSVLDRLTEADSCTPTPPASTLGQVPVGTIQCNGNPSDQSTLCYQSQVVNNCSAVHWALVKNESWQSAVVGLYPQELPNGDAFGELGNRLNNLTGGILVDPAATTGSPNGVPSNEDDPLTKFLWLLNFPGNFVGAIRNSEVQ